MAKIVVPGKLTLDSTTVQESSLPEYNSATTYSIGQQVKYTAGQELPHHEFEALKQTTGNVPVIGGSENWLDLGATNQHRMFDGYNNSSTVISGGDGMTVTISPQVRTGCLALLGLKNVETITVSIYDGDMAELSSNTYSTITSFDPVGFWSYCFREYKFTKSLVVPLYDFEYQPIIEITMTGSNIECGQCIIGKEYYIGETDWGGAPSLNNFSLFEKDDFGVTQYVKRQVTRVGDYTVWVDTKDFDRVYSLLESIISSLFLFDANNEYSNMDSVRVYGMLTKFSPGLSYGRTPIDIRVEGLE